MGTPSFTRLDVDERRRRLLEVGARAFTERSYDEVSMNDLARAAGISKGLLYHYFPSKRDLFTATLAAAAGELAAVTAPDPSLPPAEQLSRSVTAYLAWIEDNADGYRRLLESAGSQDVRDLIEDVRERTVDQIVAGVTGGNPRPALRVAVRAWLWGMDGAILDWLDRGDVTRDQVRDLLVATFAGALAAATQVDPEVTLALG
ncbi:MAG TPA: TetR/AcrR family transcriptional regulator [Thermoleophilaceae bacterium]|nr:TetR/AcrR family transcriptional regulator [Thermoleophilaceae bacterium]